uniref:Putative peptidoglycan binding domain protein n=1 Tax=Siphoviridae sp. ctPsO101 TaxID=2825487 RepID=A0A8S5PWG5_9CAUD|nr:MAG TPA: putative peptidoglycan binding domain protein [Siphoviridae sp. ctPsO101]
MAIMVSSARSDERGRYSGGKAGDQKQKSKTNDTRGEVSMQPMYTNRKGWYILRPKKVSHADAIADGGTRAANNPNIGYSQSDRLGVVKRGINTKVKTNADCSSLVRQAVREATGRDPGNFTTANEAKVLAATGLFTKICYVNQSKTPVYNGDILVTKTKGHTVIVVSGNPRPRATVGNPYPVPTRTIKLTSPMMNGDDVKWIQYHLIRLGFLPEKNSKGKSNIDGTYGKATRAAVMAAQEHYGIKADGIVGAGTVDVLR